MNASLGEFGVSTLLILPLINFALLLDAVIARL